MGARFIMIVTYLGTLMLEEKKTTKFIDASSSMNSMEKIQRKSLLSKPQSNC